MEYENKLEKIKAEIEAAVIEVWKNNYIPAPYSHSDEIVFDIPIRCLEFRIIIQYSD